MDNTLKKVSILVDIIKERCESLKQHLPDGQENYWMLIASTVILEDIQELFSEEIKHLDLDFDVDERYLEDSKAK